MATCRQLLAGHTHRMLFPCHLYSQECERCQLYINPAALTRPKPKPKLKLSPSLSPCPCLPRLLRSCSRLRWPAPPFPAIHRWVLDRQAGIAARSASRRTRHPCLTNLVGVQLCIPLSPTLLFPTHRASTYSSGTAPTNRSVMSIRYSTRHHRPHWTSTTCLYPSNPPRCTTSPWGGETTSAPALSRNSLFTTGLSIPNCRHKASSPTDTSPVSGGGGIRSGRWCKGTSRRAHTHTHSLPLFLCPSHIADLKLLEAKRRPRRHIFTCLLALH